MATVSHTALTYLRSSSMFFSILATAALAQISFAHPPGKPPGHGPHSGPQPWGYFVNSTIYQPTGKQSITYPRFVELEDETIIATSALSGNNPNYFPIFESKDGGASWTYISNLTDQVNGWGMDAQPALTELPFPLGGYPAGTILGSGNSWSSNGTRIDLYASTDRARSWHFVSHIAQGGPPNTTNGATPVWEPTLLYVHLIECSSCIL